MARGGIAPSSVIAVREGVAAAETSRLPAPAVDIVDGLGTSLRPSSSGSCDTVPVARARSSGAFRSSHHPSGGARPWPGHSMT
jgi:hypothetical protein